MNKSKSFKTDHPTIKEITIGDKFILNDGQIVTFTKYNDSLLYPFIMYHHFYLHLYYTEDLKFDFHVKNHPLDIKHKYIPLKDKLDLL